VVAVRRAGKTRGAAGPIVASICGSHDAVGEKEAEEEELEEEEARENLKLAVVGRYSR